MLLLNLKDQTGSLLHISRKTNKGLQNTATLCWLNAALQAIATTPLHMLLKGTKCTAEILSLK